MAGLKIKGGKVKSIAGLKSSLKKGGGSQYLARVPADDSLTVRFLTEPEGEWVEYMEHYDAVRKFYPCTESGCPGCAEGDFPSKRFLANALDVAEGKVIPLAMPKTLAASVMKKYEKYGTLLDRDYELTREGSGFDTTYDSVPEAPTKMNLKRFDLIDLTAMLQSQLDMADNAGSDDDDDDDDEPVAKKTKKFVPKKPAAVEDDDDDDEDEDEEPVKKPAARKKAVAKKPVAVDEDEDEDEDEEDETPTRASLSKMTLVALKAQAKEAGSTVADLKGLDKDAIIDLILGESEDEEEAEPDDDDDDESLSEEDLRNMSLAEVKKVARELGIKIKPGTPKDEIVELILDMAAEDDDEDGDEPPF